MRRWPTPGRSWRRHSAASAARFRAPYAEHIAIEEAEVFDRAEQVLSAGQLAGLGRRMAARRGVKPESAR
jgi:hemerythrin-like domain-containing protein